MKRSDFKKKRRGLFKRSEIMALFIISIFSSMIILGFPKFSLNIATQTNKSNKAEQTQPLHNSNNLPVLDSTLKPDKFQSKAEYFQALSQKATRDATIYAKWSKTDPKNQDYYEAKRLKSLKLSQKYLDLI
jgi:hypothetical protein